MKLFIFDLDGTFYNIGDMLAYNFQQQKEFLSRKLNISLTEAEKILLENHIYPFIKEDAKSCSEYFQSISLDMDEWNKIRTDDFPVEKINKECSLDSDTIKLYKEKGIVVIVSNNTLKNVERVLAYLNIDKNMFDCIVSKETQGADSKNKMNAYSRLLSNYHIDPADSLAIGDRYNIDVLPLLNLKGHGVVVQGPIGVKDFIQNKKTDTYICY